MRIEYELPNRDFQGQPADIKVEGVLIDGKLKTLQLLNGSLTFIGIYGGPKETSSSYLEAVKASIQQLLHQNPEMLKQAIRTWDEDKQKEFLMLLHELGFTITL